MAIMGILYIKVGLTEKNSARTIGNYAVVESDSNEQHLLLFGLSSIFLVMSASPIEDTFVNVIGVSLSRAATIALVTKFLAPGGTF
jgi:hypothetical protein